MQVGRSDSGLPGDGIEDNFRVADDPGVDRSVDTRALLVTNRLMLPIDQ